MWDLIVSVPGHCVSFYFAFKVCINVVTVKRRVCGHIGVVCHLYRKRFCLKVTN